MPRTISTNYLNGLTLTNAGDSPLSIVPGVTIESATSTALQSNLVVYSSIANVGDVLSTFIRPANAPLFHYYQVPGVRLAGGGALTNLQGATISGYGIAVTMPSGTIVNQGQILSAGGGPAIQYGFNHVFGVVNSAVLLRTGGVSNGPTGVITGPVGVYLPGHGSVVNAGNISGSSFGVVLTAGDSVTNATGGTISAIRGQGGISMYNQPGGLINGIYQYHGEVSLANQGTVAGGAALGGGFVTNASGATISGGLLMDAGGGGFPGYITNDGIILGTGAGSVGSGTISQSSQQRYETSGVYAPRGIILTNGASGTISGGYGVVVSGDNQINTVINRGKISGSQTGGGAGVEFTGYGTVTNYGTISGAQAVVFGPGFGLSSYSLLRVAPGAVFAGVVAGNTASSGNFLELLSGSSIGTINGFGTQYQNFRRVTLDGGARWSLGGTVAAGTSVAFAGGGALTLADPRSMNGTIAGFEFGETISLAGIADATGVSLSTTGNVLTVSESSGPGLALKFDPTQSFSGETFSYALMGGGTDLTVSCFVAGTLIRTDHGPLPVEGLRPGMRAVAYRGEPVEIIWTGHRDIEFRRHPRPDSVQPVLVEAGAFGPGLPSRDLWLSPDHALFVDEVLIPVRCLINHQTIQQISVSEVTYFHIELPEHDVILAEDLPAESYLAVGDRFDFDQDGEVIGLHPDFEARLTRDVALSWETRGAAPLVMSGPRLAAVRSRLAHHARSRRLAAAVHPAQG